MKEYQKNVRSKLCISDSRLERKISSSTDVLSRLEVRKVLSILQSNRLNIYITVDYYNFFYYKVLKDIIHYNLKHSKAVSHFKEYYQSFKKSVILQFKFQSIKISKESRIRITQEKLIEF